jgi:hypothetical protein
MTEKQKQKQQEYAELGRNIMQDAVSNMPEKNVVKAAKAAIDSKQPVDEMEPPATHNKTTSLERATTHLTSFFAEQSNKQLELFQQLLPSVSSQPPLSKEEASDLRSRVDSLTKSVEAHSSDIKDLRDAVSTELAKQREVLGKLCSLIQSTTVPKT